MVCGNAYQCILYSYSNIHKEFISNLDGILHNDFADCVLIKFIIFLYHIVLNQL